MKDKDLLLTEGDLRELDAGLCYPHPGDEQRCFAHGRDIMVCFALVACRTQAAKVLAVLVNDLASPKDDTLLCERDCKGRLLHIAVVTGLTWPLA